MLFGVWSCGPCVCVCMSFLPESWSCFPGHPQGVPQDSSCRPSGTSPEHESSPMIGSPGPPPLPAYDTHTQSYRHSFPDWFAFNKPPIVKCQQHPTHRLLTVSVVSGGGRALLSPGPPSWAGEGGSTRWNSNGVRFCVRYTTWPSPAIRQTDREMEGKGAEQEQRACREGAVGWSEARQKR